MNDFVGKCSLRMNTFGYTLTSYYMFQTSTKHKNKRASVVGALFWFYTAMIAIAILPLLSRMGWR